MTSHTAGLTIEDHGSVVLLRPADADVDRRLRNLVGEEGVQWWGGALACEPRYVADIVDAIRNGEGE